MQGRISPARHTIRLPPGGSSLLEAKELTMTIPIPRPDIPEPPSAPGTSPYPPAEPEPNPLPIYPPSDPAPPLQPPLIVTG